MTQPPDNTEIKTATDAAEALHERLESLTERVRAIPKALPTKKP